MLAIFSQSKITHLLGACWIVKETLFLYVFNSMLFLLLLLLLFLYAIVDDVFHVKAQFMNTLDLFYFLIITALVRIDTQLINS